MMNYIVVLMEFVFDLFCVSFVYILVCVGKGNKCLEKR